VYSAGSFTVLFRGFRIVGPFVVMIYKMIHTDLLRFFAIYLVFLIGFSQGNGCVFIVPTKAREHVVTGVGLCVCLSVCLSVTTITEEIVDGLYQILWEGS